MAGIGASAPQPIPGSAPKVPIGPTVREPERKKPMPPETGRIALDRWYDRDFEPRPLGVGRGLSLRARDRPDRRPRRPLRRVPEAAERAGRRLPPDRPRRPAGLGPARSGAVRAGRLRAG